MSKAIRLFAGTARGFFLVAAVVGVLVGGAARSFATQRVQVYWDPTTYNDIVAYHVFYGTQSGLYTNAVAVSDPDDVIISGLQEGLTYYFAVSQTDAGGTNSALSAEVAYTVPIPQPVVLQSQPYTDGNGNILGIEITATGSVANSWELDYSTDLQNWNFYEAGYGSYVDVFIDMVNDYFVGGSPQAFFRLQND